MFVFARAVTYAALFIGFVLIYLPGRLLSWTGIVRPAAMEVPQAAGMVIGAVGAVVALWCIFTFATSEEALRRPSIRLAGWGFGVPTVSCGIPCNLGAGLSL